MLYFQLICKFFYDQSDKNVEFSSQMRVFLLLIVHGQCTLQFYHSKKPSYRIFFFQQQQTKIAKYALKLEKIGTLQNRGPMIFK